MNDVSSSGLTIHPNFPRIVSADACAPDVIMTSTPFFVLWMVNEMVGLFGAKGTPPGVVATQRILCLFPSLGCRSSTVNLQINLKGQVMPFPSLSFLGQPGH